MSALRVRKTVVQLEEIRWEAGHEITPTTRKVTIAAVINNPFAGRFESDLAQLYDLGAEVSSMLVTIGLDALKADASAISGFGKGAIIGTDGEIEHAAALLHPKFGAPVRAAVEGKDVIPSTKKMGAPGSTIIFPLTGKTSIWDVDHMDAAEITIPDAPHRGEAVVILALAIGGRPLHRVKIPK